MKILVQVKDDKYFPVIKEKGDWIDLYAAEDIELLPSTMIDPITNTISFRSVKIDLGVAMALPKGFEALVAPRSSLFNKKGLLLVNSIGVIDNSYRGNEDYWAFQALVTRVSSIKRGEAICQFRIQPSQKATILAKLRWLFSNRIILVKSKLGSKNRGGLDPLMDIKTKYDWYHLHSIGINSSLLFYD